MRRGLTDDIQIFELDRDESLIESDLVSL